MEGYRMSGAAQAGAWTGALALTLWGAVAPAQPVAPLDWPMTDADPGRSATQRFFTPLSLRFSAWAWPWLP